MILITGASGKTGRAVLKSLKIGSEPVRVLVHRSEHATSMLNAGADEAVTGDLLSEADLDTACRGVRAVYHICPNVHPQETAIAQIALTAAARNGVERFVYHSVLHPQIEAMPHHWNKLRVEELIFSSGLSYTILQPCAYMQNVQGYWSQITSQGVYPVPYTVEARLSVVDLEDVAEVAAQALLQPGHSAACYELSGPEPLRQSEVAEILRQELGRPVRAVEIPLDDWDQQARKNRMDDYARQTLIKMFEYYNKFGLVGNSSVLGGLLKRPPTRFKEYVRRILTEPAR